MAGPFKEKAPLVLASASPRRKELLGSLGIAFDIQPCVDPEPLPEPGEAPHDFAARAAEAKAMELAAHYPDKYILGADTIVVLGNTILGKPQDKPDALRMLRMLSGQTHEVITGCCLIAPARNGQRQKATFTPSTQVRMTSHPDDTLTAYIETGEPMDKAGAYAIQGIGGFLVEWVGGSYTNVVGLPVARVLEVLLEWEVVGAVK